MTTTKQTLLADIAFDERRARVRATTVEVAGVDRPAVNGIDRLEVRLLKAADPVDDLAVLTITFIHPLDGRVPDQPPFLAARDVSVQGGDRITEITTLSVTVVDGGLEVVVSPLGDTSDYALAIDNSARWLDPIFASMPFSFAIDCDTTFDCSSTLSPPPAEPAPPLLDHLARDWASFRQMLLDRMALTAPEWAERSIADMGVAFVELLAHVGDRLTYRQDVVATEAYLGTARRRVSVARHLRLVDQRMHDGAAARVAVHLTVTDDLTVRPGARFWTRNDGDPVSTTDADAPEAAETAGAVLFETVDEVICRPAHNQIDIHSWTGTFSTLPAGATSVALRDPVGALRLVPGDLLLLEQHVDPEAGNRRRPDPTKRHMVRVTSVDIDTDPVSDPTTGVPLPLVVVHWSDADALPFDLPLHATAGSGLGAEAPVAVARANLAVADHGRTTRHPVQLPAVPAPNPVRLAARYRPLIPMQIANIRPVGSRTAVPPTADVRRQLHEANGSLPGLSLHRALSDAGIALDAPQLFAAGLERWTVVDRNTLTVIADTGDELVMWTMPLSAAELFADDDAHAVPAITLHRQVDPTRVVIDEPSDQWDPLPDLLSSVESTQGFVVELEREPGATWGTQHLRFGDDDHGMAPNEGTDFRAVIRTGGGTAGNVGSDTIVHAQFGTATVAGTTDRVVARGNPAVVRAVRNPLPASGGLAPETIDDAKIRAPAVFAQQLRAVRPDDYARWLETHPRVQRAVVTRRWTGSWPTLFCTVDPRAEWAMPVEPSTTTGTKRPTLETALKAELVAWLERRRTMGHDIQIDGPEYVPLELHLHLIVAPTASRSEVLRQATVLLGSGRVNAQTLGLFHPDARTFGQSVALSRIYAAAQAVPGVVAVDILALRRQGTTDDLALTSGLLRVGTREIVELANDSNHPERGLLTIDVEGGR